ncbi:MAG: GTP cyclohydrolase II [Candidatus Micrarchaeota archaeon]
MGNNRDMKMVKELASANLPTRFGDFRIFAFTNKKSCIEHAVLLKGTIEGKTHVPTRIHSECVTGDAFSSMKCDCGMQLQKAMQYISDKGFGVIIYLRQEGRGIGFANKIRAYALQDRGYDTVEANKALGLPDDLRDYREAAAILHHLGVKSVSLLTNNPKKVEGLENCGITVSERVPIETKPNPHNEQYLKVKKSKLGHLLNSV